MTRDLTKWLAFTLAEVLITLAIIGVVAALTIPSLLANTNEKGLNTSDSVFQRRLGEALKIMNLQGTLAGQPSTQAFVDELGRHMKIMKTCPSNELSNCFVSEFQSGDETIEVKYLKESKNLYHTPDYGTETIGVVFGNGTRALIAYNPNCKQDQFNNSNEAGSPVILKMLGSGKQTLVSLGTDSISILYNLQERKDKNVYNSGNSGNIRGINIDIDTGCLADTDAVGSCIKVVADSSTFAKDHVIDCTAGSTDPYKADYCDGNGDFTEDYWATAKKYCKDKGLTLISKNQLGDLGNYLYGGGSSFKADLATAISPLFTPTHVDPNYSYTPPAFWIWSSSKANSTFAAYYNFFASPYSGYYYVGYNDYRNDPDVLAVCVGD